MLPVCDRVLTSRSKATLVALVVIVAFLLVMKGALGHARGRVPARACARLQARLDSRVLRAILSRSTSLPERSRPATGLRDLKTIQQFASSSGPFAFFDAPWTPKFLFALFVLYRMLGELAVLSGSRLLLVTLLNQKGAASLQEQLGERQPDPGGCQNAAVVMRNSVSRNSSSPSRWDSRDAGSGDTRSGLRSAGIAAMAIKSPSTQPLTTTRL